MRRLRLMAMLVLLGVMLSACPQGGAKWTTPPVVRHPVSAESREDPAVRAAMLEHLHAVWPQIHTGLTNSASWNPPATATQAAAAHIGTITPDWGYDPSRLASDGASPWLGLVRPYSGHDYLIAIDANGATFATAKAWDMNGGWAAFPVRNWQGDAVKAPAQFDRYFGATDYETAFVEQGGVWILARRGMNVAGVMLEPWGESHRGSTPHGLVSGRKLAWWLEHPLGE